MRQFEVRCCCIPERLLGWLDVPEDARREVSFAQFEDGYLKAVTLPIEMLSTPGRPGYWAIKAEGMTIDELRKIPGFKEAV